MKDEELHNAILILILRDLMDTDKESLSLSRLKLHAYSKYNIKVDVSKLNDEINKAEELIKR